MVHLSIQECRRLARVANEAGTGPSHRIGIADKLRQAARERQVDPKSSPDELFEIIGLLAAMGERL